jgi:hypothetical protein
MTRRTRRASDEELIAVAKRFPDKREMRAKAGGVYQNILIRKLQDRAFAHMPVRAKRRRFDFNNLAAE